MIVRLTGNVVEVTEESAILERDGVAREVLIPGFAVGELTACRGKEMSLHTIEFIEANQSGGNMTPRLVGFVHPEDRVFFRHFISVKGIGLRKAMKALAEPIRAIAAEAAAPLAKEKQFDFIEDFSSKFTVRVLFAALGLPMGDERTVRDKAVLMVQTDPKTRAKGPEHIAASDWMRDYAAGVIAERRANPQNDLISHFSTAEIDGDRLDEREVLLTTTTLIMAGIESLGGFMSMFALNMADYADARAACVKDPELLADAIEESLRFNTSAQRFRRCVTKDTELHGQTMKAGDFVCLAYGSGNRDERKYENPDVYDIARKPRGHLGFGGSVHACLGTAIARMSVKIAMEEFHKVVPNYARVQQQLPWMPSSTFRSPMVLEFARV